MLRSELPTAGDPSFGHGLFTGLAAAAVLVQIWFALLLAPLREMYDEVVATGTVDVPCLSRLMVHPAWLWGVPVAGALLVGALVVWRPRRRGPYVACAMLLICTAVATFALSQAPARQLAGLVQPDPQMQLVPVGP